MKKCLLILLLLISHSVLAFELESSDYKLLEGDETLCSSGPVQIIKDESSEILMIGTIISIPLIKEKTIEKVADGKCQQVDELQDSKNKIIFTSVIQNCAKTLKHLEKKVVQSVLVEGEKIFYTHTQGAVTKRCRLQKEKK